MKPPTQERLVLGGVTLQHVDGLGWCIVLGDDEAEAQLSAEVIAKARFARAARAATGHAGAAVVEIHEAEGVPADVVWDVRIRERRSRRRA